MKRPLPAEQLRHVVWCEDGGVPTVVHPTWGGAYYAASKLAQQHPGHRFHIMQTRAIRVSAVKDAAA